jgi:hypothetical protein
MPSPLQDFLATATQKAADDLVTAQLRIPEDKRLWSAEDKARPALDLIAECAILNGYTAELIQTGQWSTTNAAQFSQDKSAAIGGDWDSLQALLMENTLRVIAAIRATSDDKLGNEIQMPWSKMTLAEVMAYPYWNMTYHEGQTNYIASMLGCLG